MSEILTDILGIVLRGMAERPAVPQQEGAAPVGEILSQLLGKADLGSVGALLQQLAQSGLASQVASWLGNGDNLPVSIDQLRHALGDQRAGELAHEFGVPVEQALRHLADHLPDAIDRLSTKGTLARDLGP